MQNSLTKSSIGRSFKIYRKKTPCKSHAIYIKSYTKNIPVVSKVFVFLQLFLLCGEMSIKVCNSCTCVTKCNTCAVYAQLKKKNECYLFLKLKKIFDPLNMRFGNLCFFLSRRYKAFFMCKQK